MLPDVCRDKCRRHLLRKNDIFILSGLYMIIPFPNLIYHRRTALMAFAVGDGCALRFPYRSFGTAFYPLLLCQRKESGFAGFFFCAIGKIDNSEPV